MLADAFADLLLGSSCVGCARPGRPLCPPCRDSLPRTSTLAWPTPAPYGLAPPFAAGEYDGTLRAMVLAHKERRVLSLTGPLGALVAASVHAGMQTVLGPAATGAPVVLVPVPSRSQVVRARGHDPTRAMTCRAGHLLRAAGSPTVVAGLLRTRPGVVDQAGLTSDQRRANLAGSMACSTTAVRRLRRRVDRAYVVVCDDVLTTGATAREAQRALEAVGVEVLAIATAAATRRRRGSGDPMPGRP